MVEVDTEQFSLRWNNFHSNLTAGFHALLEEVDLVDVTLAAGGQFVQAHKIVLSVCSPYFKQLFKVNPCKHPIVILKDVCHKELEAILQFMYQGEVNVRQEELATFLKTAEMLQIKGLTGHDTQENNAPIPTPNPMHRSVREREKSVPTEPILLKQEEPHPRPYKRTRTEPPAPPIVPIPTPVHNPMPASPRTVKDDPSGVEFVEITKPKDEPVEYESDMEEVVENKPTSREDPLVQLLQGETSQSHQDASQGSAAGLFASIPGLPQDSGGSQDGLQDFCRQDTGRTTLEKQLLPCNFCHKVFSRRDSLQSHVSNIHGKLRGPFRCLLCGKLSKNKKSLNTHMYGMHSKSRADAHSAI